MFTLKMITRRRAPSMDFGFHMAPMSVMTSTRLGRATLAIILVLAVLSLLGIAAAWWFLMPQDRVVSYIKFSRQQFSPFRDRRSVSEEEFRTQRNNHKGLLEAPMVLEAALQQQDIANLELVRRQADPIGWLSRSLVVTLPDDSEIIEVSLPCDLGQVRDTEDAVKVVDAVVKAYFDKVVLQDRLLQASALADAKLALGELESRLAAKLEALYESNAATKSPAEKAKSQLLKDECVALRQMRSELKGKLLMADLEQSMEARRQLTGGSDGRVHILQPATVIDD